MFEHPNRVFTYNEIMEQVWDDYENDKVDALKTLIKNLRKKLPPETIVNVFGTGYKVVS